ncbi:MAG TPA: hypothetical protein VH165_33990 [Kofleriaceae bacterium]|nr:hypothetical protein [Kofleriaceae bacterium]
MLTLTSLMTFRPPVQAQSAEAEVLFRDGRGLLKRGQLGPGCDKLAASERLESSVGTLLNLGDCRERLGKLASAWAAFRKAEAMAQRTGGDDKRKAEAGRRAAALEPRLPNLVIEVSHPVNGLVIRRDDEIIDPAQWSTGMPVDPGNYVIVAEAPGFRPWHTTAPVAANNRRQIITVPALEPAGVTPAGVTPAGAALPTDAVGSRAAPSPAVDRSASAREPARGTWSTARELSAGLAVAGAATLGAGAYFGVHANDLKDRANQRCPLVVCADSEGLRLNDQAQTAALRANVLYVAGGAVVATAIVMWLVGAPGETSVVPTVAPTGGDHQLGVALAGQF